MLLSAALPLATRTSVAYGLDPRYLQSILLAQQRTTRDGVDVYNSILPMKRERNSVTGVVRPPGSYDYSALENDVASAAQRLARILTGNGASEAELASASLVLENRPEALEQLFTAYYFDHDDAADLALRSRTLLLRAVGKTWQPTR